jgi:hypothetical protein
LKQESLSIPLFETQYFPSVGFFALAIHYGKLFIELQENYQKRGFRNKCPIVASHGVETLSIPLLKGKNQQLAIKEVRIAYDQDWINHHWKSLQTAYGKSAFFIHYGDKLKSILDKKHSYLFDLNTELLYTVMGLLHINCQIEYTSSYWKECMAPVIDLRNQTDLMHPDKSLAITLESHPYPQLFSDRLGFTDKLSILDLLFCMGPDSVGILKQFKIIDQGG